MISYFRISALASDSSRKLQQKHDFSNCEQKGSSTSACHHTLRQLAITAYVSLSFEKEREKENCCRKIVLKSADATINPSCIESQTNSYLTGVPESVGYSRSNYKHSMLMSPSVLLQCYKLKLLYTCSAG